ncbi:hypothetical protein LPW26_21790 [Rhodopseudomonas sp. HC1]|uniref:hypothetical protein n=1 Tax=Rhodopseudomonas infernalis TaxID=2897386 RepID=UPI001EE920B1|nr:hypothetical protein [Rhodopseudomonas infernalis]MCG6207287.1 hypothetical protein [Rhodopseudomonas infernalis]
MTPERFRELAEIWGGDIERWPKAEWPAAREIARTDAGSAILREQHPLDALLASAPDVSPARADRAALAVLGAIAASESRPPWYRRWLQPVSLLPAGSLACSALLGIWLAGALPYHQDEQAVATVAAVFDASVISLWGNQ